MSTNIVNVIKSSTLTALPFRAVAISTNEYEDEDEESDAAKIIHIDEIWALEHIVADRYHKKTVEEALSLQGSTEAFVEARGYRSSARISYTRAVVVRDRDFQQLSAKCTPKIFKADWGPEQDLQRLEARLKQAVQERYWGDEICNMEGDERPWGDELIKVCVHTCEKSGSFRMDDAWRLEACVDSSKRGPNGEYVVFEDDFEDE